MNCVNCVNDNIHQYLNKKPNYYTILNVNSTSSKEEIRQSYLRLSKIYHPDKCKDIHANELFNLIGKAYENLSITPQSTFTHTELVHSFLHDVIDKEYIDLYTKMILTPDNLSLKDIVTLGYSFYKMR
jgi:hypothetical protein